MAWRNPRFSTVHALRDAGAASITSNNALATGSRVDSLLDDMSGVVMQFATSESDHYIQIDRGTGFAAVNRLWIPPTHNITGTIDLEADTDAGFPSPTSLISGVSVFAGTAIDEDFTINSERYVRLTFNGTGQFYLGELVLTLTLETTRGPDPNWQDELSDPATLHLPLIDGSIANVIHGPDRRRWSYQYNRVTNATDLVLLEALHIFGTARAILLDPAYDDEAAVFAFVSGRGRGNDRPQPAAVPGKSRFYRFEFLENVA